ncbi:MAG: glycosyltransferase family 2 protein [Dermatophilaceae bacterium]|nr:glycosyltransferase family 2 protein [Intrasporangiaceae bacterium]
MDEADEDREAWPSVTVIIPVLNEARHLADAVAMVQRQDYPGELDVVLAVGPSDDGTEEIAARISAADARVTTVPNPSGRTPQGLNAAIAAARGEIVVRVDGHSELPPDYVRVAVAELRRVGADNVGGVMDAQGRSPFERAVACAMKSPLGVGGARFHVGGKASRVETVYLGVFRREALERVGGYDEHFARAQDWEMNHRIRQGGGVVWFTPDLKVTYRPRSTVRRLADQYFNYGRWRRVVARHHQGTMNVRYLAPPVMVVVVGTALAGAVLEPRLLLIPLTYAGGVLLGGVVISRGESPLTRLLTPAVITVMHWSWGVGFLTSPRRIAR